MQGRLDTWLNRDLKALHPAHFDVVMATGIVAVACQFEHLRWLALGLTFVNIALFIVLFAMNLARAVCYPAACFRDLADFQRGPGFFTIAAGLGIVGSEMILVLNRHTPALLLWIIAIPLWAFFMYAIFTDLTVNENKPRFEDGINGGWLLSVVATQSVAGLAAELSGDYPVYGSEILFFALVLWLAGGMLYVWLISLIFYRFTFFRFRPRDFIPPFWINMGAMAISTLTGATLVAHSSDAVYMRELLPFLKGFTIFFWATATWWIPMLAILSYWQHVVKKLGRSYTFLYWTAVFPLGMYSACSYRLSLMMNLPFLLWIPRLFIYLAVIGWAITFAGMIRHLTSGAAARTTTA